MAKTYKVPIAGDDVDPVTSVKTRPEQHAGDAVEALDGLSGLSVRCPVPGAVLAGWTLESPLGRGGMGLVFLARRAGTEQAGALKVLAKEQTASTQGAKRLRREVLALQRLRHPRVVAILDEHLDYEPPFFVMELLAGGSLHARLGLPGVNSQGGLPAGELPLLMLDLVEALEAIHAVGVLHRDLKPQNVLFTEEGRAKLADFGLAWAVDLTALTATGDVVGTWAYLAPETLRGAPFSPRTDLYQLGVTLFEAASGSQPYATQQLQALLVGEPLPPLPALEPLAPEACRLMPWLPPLLQELASPRPEDRPGSATELRTKLDALLDKTKEAARPTSKLPALSVAQPDANRAPVTKPGGERVPLMTQPGGAWPPLTRPPSAAAGEEPASQGERSSWPVLVGLSRLGTQLPAIPVGLAVVLVGLLLLILSPLKPWLGWRAEDAGVVRPAWDDDSRQRPAGLRTSAAGARPDRVTVGVDRAAFWYEARPDAPFQVRVSDTSGRELLSRDLTVQSGRAMVEDLQPGRAYSVNLTGPRTSSEFPVETLEAVEEGGLPVLATGLEAPQFLSLAASERSAAVVWTSCGGGDTARSMQLRQSYDAGRTWTSIEALETSPHCLMSPVTTFSAGRLLAAWTGHLGTPGEIALVRLPEFPASAPAPGPLLVSLDGDLVGLQASATGALRFYLLTRPEDGSPRQLTRVVAAAGSKQTSAPEPLAVVAGPDLPAEAYALANVSVVESGGKTFVFGVAYDRSQYGRLCWGVSPSEGPPLPLRAVSHATDVRHCAVAALQDRVVVAFESQSSVRCRVLGLDGQWLGPEIEVVPGGAVPALTGRAGELTLTCAAPSQSRAHGQALVAMRSSDGSHWTGRDLCPWNLPAPRWLAAATTAETLVVATVTAGGQLLALAVEPEPAARRR